MQFFKTRTKTAQQADVDLALQTANIEKDALPIQNETAVVQQQPIDPELERRVVRKTDMNLVPLVMALCALHCITPIPSH